MVNSTLVCIRRDRWRRKRSRRSYYRGRLSIGCEYDSGRERPKPSGEALGFDPITLILIFGEYDAVLVAEAAALANWDALLKLRSWETDSISERRTTWQQNEKSWY